jgi:uncharacterized glyoxalase superfamily protein PhnB
VYVKKAKTSPGGGTMSLSSLYPVLLTDQVKTLSEFYQNHFQMLVTFESDWYVSLRKDGKEGSFQLALLKSDHPSIPEDFRDRSKGIIVNVEVENADKMYEQLITNCKLPIHLDIRSEDWGQRHFITSDPDNNLLDIIEIIEPSEEFLAQYTDGVC